MMRIDNLSDGLRYALTIGSIILIVKETAFLIEDPEVHQHLKGLIHLLDFILKIAKKRKQQLFITTHSLELVNIVKKLSEEQNIELKIFFIERDREGIVDVIPLSKVDVEICRKLGLDSRFLYMF